MADSQRKTANLLDFNALKTAPAGQMPDSSAFTFEHLLILTLNPNTTYTLSSTGTGSTSGDADANRSLYYGGVSADYVVYSGHSCSYTAGDDGKVYIGFLSSRSNAQQYLDGTATIMLNEGSQPKPYEPYSSTGWVHSLRKLTTATEAVENPLYSDGTAITAYTIKGNATQSGTPTPSNPVDVNGVGVRTENLYNNTYYIQNANRNHCTVEALTTGFKLISNGGDTYLGSAGKSPNTASSTTINSSIEVKPETKYTLHLSSSPWCFVSYIGADGTYLNTSYINIPQRYVPIDYTFTTPANCKYVLFRLGSGVVESGDETSITDIMLVEGETAPTSYIPYGYKIPILTSQGSAVNYLGSVTSNRQIKKLVLTGDETLSYQVQPPLFLINIPTNYFIPQVTALCTEYKYNPVQSSILANSQHGDFGLQYVNVRDEYNVWFNNSTFATNAEFKAYLAQQYANGTPVTIWYVLQTATTGIVNEPLMKIGDYADTLSNATAIPTTDGANSITVDTTVQPSEFTATWSGWHNAYVKEKSENLWDEDYTNISSDIYYKPVYVGDYEIVTVSSAVPLTSQNFTNLFALSGQQSSGASTSNNGVYSGRSIAARPVDGYITIAYRNINGVNPQDYDTMVNEGRTALPYEPYWK